MPNKYYLREDRKAVKPEREMPECWRPGNGSLDDCPDCWNWYLHLRSLPALDVDPDYLKRLSPGWFEGEERYEFLSIPDAEQSWLECTKEQFDLTNHKYRRLTIVAPQEADKGHEGDRYAKLKQKMREFFDSVTPEELIEKFEKMGYTFVPIPATPQPVTEEDAKPWEAAIDYCNENGITGENELRQNFKSFLAGHSYAAASRPSDAVDADFTLWVVVNKWFYNWGTHKWENTHIGECSGMALTHSELYQLFKSKQPTP